MNKVRIETDRTIFSNKEIKHRGVKLVCQNLAGEFVYMATEKALEWVKTTFKCVYLNDNDQLVTYE